ncbi:DUF421 domain-containing protein [Chitinophaga horti]|uniref:DUF421 domain-containing protein n=1 Tax=Chitinophaga horti TaxID=2920382 RepID=A0ABY6JB65_9BACT|nr:YetF domain-containing protein [Chitinophaga horti]UYQ95627.1 DUF421 domain-containing protein [Chitinophaga horti]
MQRHEIFFDDIQRWLFGLSSPEFLIEIFFRTILIYLLLLLTVRLLGSRMAAQSTVTEMAVMITLGAIVSPVMQISQRGLVFGIVALVCALLFQRGLNFWAYKNSKIETLTQGRTHMLVLNGRINLPELQRSRVTRQQLFALLRGEEVYTLGDVERAYMEACGILTIFKMKKPQAGLAVMPPADKSMLGELFRENEQSACGNCGHTQPVSQPQEHCPVCTLASWEPTFISKQ